MFGPTKCKVREMQLNSSNNLNNKKHLLSKITIKTMHILDVSLNCISSIFIAARLQLLCNLDLDSMKIN
jgi:hypothetical protein